MKNENWKPVKGYEGLYEVSNLGRVKSLKKTVIYKDGRKKNFNETILKHGFNPRGYQMVVLCINGSKNTKTIHRLVALSFIPNPCNKPQINHKDGDKCNNNTNNLEWVTAKENTVHSYQIGLNKSKGENHPSSKLTDLQVNEIRNLKGFETVTAIAEMFNISRSQVSNIHLGKMWRNKP